MRTLFLAWSWQFYFSNKSCFPPRARTFFVSSTLLPLLDCGDVFKFGYRGTAVPSDLLLAKNVFLNTVPCMQRHTGHLWMYPGINTGSVLFINLSLAWFLLIYLHVSKASKASIAYVLVMSVRCVRQSWVVDHSVSLPSLRRTLQNDFKLSDLLSFEAFGSISDVRQPEAFGHCLSFLNCESHYQCTNVLDKSDLDFNGQII